MSFVLARYCALNVVTKILIQAMINVHAGLFWHTFVVHASYHDIACSRCTLTSFVETIS